MKKEELYEMSEREELLSFVEEVFGGYAEGLRNPSFDRRSFLTAKVLEAYLLYVQFELRIPAGEC